VNRIRTEGHTQDDIKLLEFKKSSHTEQFNNYLHIYARNFDVDHFNSEKLICLQQQIQILTAIDKKNRKFEKL
jgi:hypothetical protein